MGSDEFTSNLEATQNKIEVMQACIEGKTIQLRTRGHNKWKTVPHPKWDWAIYEYQIKPEPQIIWVNFYASGSFYAHSTKKLAERRGGGEAKRTAVPFVEVIDNDD